MNCTRVLHKLNLSVSLRVLHMLNPPPGGSSPIMPVDMAMRICLASSPPLRSLLSNYDYNRCSTSVCCEPLRPCLTSSSWDDAFSYTITTATAAKTTAHSEIDDNQTCPKRKKKKNVVFADTLGLALTYIHVFDEAEDELLTELQFHLTEIEGVTTGLHLGDNKGPADRGSVLVLDFTQPAADYLDLRNRLKAQQVSLETCSVQDRLLSEFLDPSNRVEFCIQYQTPDQTFWDNNHGNNYQVGAAEPNGSPCRSTESIPGLEIQRDTAREKREGVDFDPFGSPRTSAGIFPEWQSWVRVETSAPYW
uniref:protein phosphatase 1 regulatory subunit 3C-B-like isoform X3 n=1 Tax=Semicossyphus pulcher TaxID=241346 RepID=UPI0037E75DAC